MGRDEPVLDVGDCVVRVDHCDGDNGTVVERLDGNYVRVRWAHFIAATTHRIESLARSSMPLIDPRPVCTSYGDLATIGNRRESSGRGSCVDPKMAVSF